MSASRRAKSEGIDEINLLDLAVTFVRNKHVFLVVFFIVFALSVVVAFVANDKYRYTSLVQLTESAPGNPLVLPDKVVAVLSSRIFPEMELAYRDNHKQRMPFSVEFSRTGGASLIRIVSEASLGDGQRVDEVHSEIVSYLMSRQQTIEKRYVDQINAQIEDADSMVEQLRGVADAGPAIASALQRKSELQDQAANVVRAEALAVTSRTADKTSRGKAFIMVIGGVLAALLGVFFTFLWAFIRLVQSRL